MIVDTANPKFYRKRCIQYSSRVRVFISKAGFLVCHNNVTRNYTCVILLMVHLTPHMHIKVNDRKSCTRFVQYQLSELWDMGKLGEHGFKMIAATGKVALITQNSV